MSRAVFLSSASERKEKMENLKREIRLLVGAVICCLVLTAIPGVMGCSWVGEAPPGTVMYIGSDILTKGDWQNAQGSPIGVYGSYAHILPNAPQPNLEVPIGPYSDPPYSWTSSQIAGLVYYRPNPNYWDEYVSLEPAVTYSITGTLYTASFEADPRALTNGTHRKAACYFGGSTGYPGPVEVTLNLQAGTYQLSVYCVDWDSYDRAEISAVSSAGASASVQVDNFHEGLYEKFFVHLPSDQTVTITVTKESGTVNAVISGIFLDSTSETPTNPDVTEVRHVGEDSLTQGDWIGTYGGMGYTLCAWNSPYRTALWWDASYDVSSGLLAASYTVTAKVYSWTHFMLTGELEIQYPVFEWAWGGWGATDPRACHFKTEIEDVGGPGVRLTCWDDGSERGFPDNGYLNVTLSFPDGTFMLSLYAYDYERWARTSETIYVTDESGALLDSVTIRGTDFDEGIYVQFMVQGPTTIVVHVVKDAESVNAVLSGIFVDKVICQYVGTIGFWKNNIGKLLKYLKGKPQILEEDMLSYISAASARCSDVFGDTDTLEEAYEILSIPDSSEMLDKAKAQLYALLLNVASGRIAETNNVQFTLYLSLNEKYPTIPQEDYPLTAGEAIDLSCNNIYTGTDLEFAKDICDVINNGFLTKA